jgi:hypothetical protein
MPRENAEPGNLRPLKLTLTPCTLHPDSALCALIARKVIGLLLLWVTAAVAACLVLMGLPQLGGRGGRDLRGIGMKRWCSRPARSGTTAPCMPRSRRNPASPGLR